MHLLYNVWYTYTNIIFFVNFISTVNERYSILKRISVIPFFNLKNRDSPRDYYYYY